MLALLDPKTFWNAPSGSSELFTKLGIALLVGFALAFALAKTPIHARKYVVFLATFLSGLFYFLYWIYPSPIARGPADAPRNPAEAVSFWISDAQPIVLDFSNVIAGFMIGLGVYSILRVHLSRVFKQQQNWPYSLVLLVSMAVMALFGFIDYFQHYNPANYALADPKNWGFINYTKDLLFDGLLQNMDAGMFSVVAFYIMSAAYRAFRARSIEASILLLTALIVMLSLLGVVELLWGHVIDGISPTNPVVQSFKLSVLTDWITKYLQTPAIRGIEFGVGIGLLAMALRIWLCLEPTGAKS